MNVLHSFFFASAFSSLAVAAPKSFFASCKLGDVTADVYHEGKPEEALAVVRKPGRYPTLVEAKIEGASSEKYQVVFHPVWNVPNFSSSHCKRETPNPVTTDVHTFAACLYFYFDIGKADTASLEELIKSKDVIPCHTKVSCETANHPDPGACLKIVLMETLIPVDSSHPIPCSF